MYEDNLTRILLLEDEEKYCKEFKAYVDTTDDFEIVGITGSAVEAIGMVKDALPEAIIVDLMLQEGDGIDFIKKVRKMQNELPIRPYIVVTTHVTSEPVMKKLHSNLADFVYTKDKVDYSASQIIAHLRLMSDCFDCGVVTNPAKEEAEVEIIIKPQVESSQEKMTRLRKRIFRELDLLCIGPNLIGKQYLADAITLAIETPGDEARMYTKFIYPTLGRRYGKRDMSIERAMRTAIQKAWRKTDLETLGKVYGAYTDPEKGYPTNSEFVQYFADKFKLQTS